MDIFKKKYEMLVDRDSKGERNSINIFSLIYICIQGVSKVQA